MHAHTHARMPQLPPATATIHTCTRAHIHLDWFSCGYSVSAMCAMRSPFAWIQVGAQGNSVKLSASTANRHTTTNILPLSLSPSLSPCLFPNISPTRFPMALTTAAIALCLRSDDEDEDESEVEDVDLETAAEKRLRLAKAFIKQIEAEEKEKAEGEEIDADAIAYRLQEDVSSQKGAS